MRTTMSAEQRGRVLEACEEFLDTPFVYQGRLPGVGLDCGGLVVLAGERAGAKPKDELVYPKAPWPKRLVTHLEDALIRRDLPLEHAPARVVLWFLRSARVPTHLGILRGDGYVYHTDFRTKKVVCNRMDATWSSRVIAQFDYPSEPWQASS